MKRLAPLLLGLTLVCGSAQAQSSGQWRGPDQIWRSSCGYCHGAGVAPELRGRRLPPQATTMIVREGAPGMPAFHPSEIGDKELRQLARWLERSPAPAPPPVR